MGWSAILIAVGFSRKPFIYEKNPRFQQRNDSNIFCNIYKGLKGTVIGNIARHKCLQYILMSMTFTFHIAYYSVYNTKSDKIYHKPRDKVCIPMNKKHICNKTLWSFSPRHG